MSPAPCLLRGSLRCRLSSCRAAVLHATGRGAEAGAANETK